MKQQYSEILKSLRKQRGLTQKQLGELIGKKESTVRMWELGTNKPSLDILQTLADYYSVSVDLILGREDLVPYFDNVKNMYLFVAKNHLQIPSMREISENLPKFSKHVDKFITLDPIITSNKERLLVCRVDTNEIEPIASEGDFIVFDRDCNKRNGEIQLLMEPLIEDSKFIGYDFHYYIRELQHEIQVFKDIKSLKEVSSQGKFSMLSIYKVIKSF